jgi:hypothetical protein
MTAQLRVFAALVILPLVCAGSTVHAEGNQSPPIPASLFPPKLTITYAPTLTNDQMDSTWGRDGYDIPYMHSQREADLQRVDGWTESGLWHHGSSYSYFAIYVSTYGTYINGRAGNVAAFADWEGTVGGFWHVPLATSQPRGIVPQATAGEAQTRVVQTQDGGPTVSIAGWWGSTEEVEAVAIFTPNVMKLTPAKKVLADLVRYAVRLPANESSVPDTTP